MAKGLMAEGWESFRQKAVPKNASEAQVRETHQAFYAGAAYLFARLMLAHSPGKEPTEEDVDMVDVAMVDGIHEELVAFVRSKGG